MSCHLLATNCLQIEFKVTKYNKIFKVLVLIIDLMTTKQVLDQHLKEIIFFANWFLFYLAKLFLTVQTKVFSSTVINLYWPILFGLRKVFLYKVGKQILNIKPFKKYEIYYFCLFFFILKFIQDKAQESLKIELLLKWL